MPVEEYPVTSVYLIHLSNPYFYAFTYQQILVLLSSLISKGEKQVIPTVVGRSRKDRYRLDIPGTEFCRVLRQ